MQVTVVLIGTTMGLHVSVVVVARRYALTLALPLLEAWRALEASS